MSIRHNARKALVQALYQWEISGQPISEIESSFYEIHDMQNVDRKYFRQAIAAIPLCDDELRSLLTPHLERGFDKIDPVERAILRLGAWELKYAQDVPTKVVLNEMVELAKTFGAEKSYRFVNGAMDKLSQSLRG